MKKAFLIVMLSAGILSSFAQTKCNIKKAYAYYTVNMPGVQMVDEKGNPVPPIPQIERFIYLEWKGSKKPEIETVYYDTASLTIVLTKVEGSSVSVGEKWGNNQPFIIKSSKGYSLWKIEAYPVEGKIPVATDCKNILLKIKSARKSCAYKILKESQVLGLPRY